MNPNPHRKPLLRSFPLSAWCYRSSRLFSSGLVCSTCPLTMLLLNIGMVLWFGTAIFWIKARA